MLETGDTPGKAYLCDSLSARKQPSLICVLRFSIFFFHQILATLDTMSPLKMLNAGRR